MKKITEKKIQEVADKIVEEFQPEKIILFGSHAWGQPRPDSDVDLFIIKETEDTRASARAIDGSLWGRKFSMDILVSTPRNVENRLRMGDLFVSEIINKGKLLYERK